MAVWQAAIPLRLRQNLRQVVENFQARHARPGPPVRVDLPVDGRDGEHRGGEVLGEVAQLLDASAHLPAEVVEAGPPALAVLILGAGLEGSDHDCA